MEDEDVVIVQGTDPITGIAFRKRIKPSLISLKRAKCVAAIFKSLESVSK
jgi:hypothetical protein